MRYAELVQLYFERSNALQWYWTLYVVVIGGLLAFSSLRKRPDVTTALLVSVLYVAFAYKNLGAIREVTAQRFAVLTAMTEAAATGSGATDGVEVHRLRQLMEPTLAPTGDSGVRNFHVACDGLTVAALWAREWRRRKAWRAQPPAAGVGAERERPREAV